MKSTPSRLAPILEAVRKRAVERRSVRSIESLRQDFVLDARRGDAFRNALRQPCLSIIAECKRSAPSAGELSTENRLDERIESYARGGADALSILTEKDHFGGDLSDLQMASNVLLPRLRKDFLLDEAMLLEAQIAGAHAVLLIVACLSPTQLAELRQQAREMGLAVLMEVHDEEELVQALPLEPDALGINARNLRTFEIDLSVTERLLGQVPKSVTKVAESGMHKLEDLQRMRDAGADAVLIGTALMRSADPAALLRQWKERLRG